MKTQICNNCGRTLKLLEKGHLFEGKVVCGDCIKILEPKRKVGYFQLAKAGWAKVKDSRELSAKLARDARTRSTEFAAANEDARYEKAKRRVIFFLNGCITLFWVIVILHVGALVLFFMGIRNWLS